MDDFMLRIFQTEVAYQCRFVLFGAADLGAVGERFTARYVQLRETYDELDRLHEAAFAVEDWDEVDRIMEQTREAHLQPDDTVSRTWFALQAILSAAANLSKLLWGSDDPRLTQAKREQRKAERKALRESLGVTDDSPLKRRAVRNQFEHFDEKLERRFRDPKKRRNYIGRNIGGRSTEDAAEDRFGHYYPDDGVVAFWDQSVVVPELVEAARNLLPVAESESMRMGGGE